MPALETNSNGSAKTEGGSVAGNIDEVGASNRCLHLRLRSKRCVRRSHFIETMGKARRPITNGPAGGSASDRVAFNVHA